MSRRETFAYSVLFLYWLALASGLTSILWIDL